LIADWTGSQRLCMALLPRRPLMPELKAESLQGSAFGRIGSTDWVGFGETKQERQVGPFLHASEYVVVRQRGNDFPALLMVSGVLFRQGLHSISSSKPITLSLDGLAGGLLNTGPDTRVQLSSPVIMPGDRYLLDGIPMIASAEGVLTLQLSAAGEHRLRREAP